ncbi:MAG: hypothetical protein AB7G68_14265 [Nitrospiraceae bacterium]
MSIPLSTEGVTNFLKQNDQLVSQIREAVEIGEDLGSEAGRFFSKLDVAKQDADELLNTLGPNVKFVVAKSIDVRAQQQSLLAAINKISESIRDFQADPELTALQLLHRSKLYKKLADTFTNTVSQVISFEPLEIDEYATLVKRADLDTDERQKAAFILDGAVGLAKFAAKVAVKLMA